MSFCLRLLSVTEALSKRLMYRMRRGRRRCSIFAFGGVAYLLQAFGGLADPQQVAVLLPQEFFVATTGRTNNEKFEMKLKMLNN